jgi:uncharacterized membrane protein YgdD (TMEM256/DUF423 family)
MNTRLILLTGIVLSGLSVVIGAFGAHALKETLAGTGRAETFELAVRYQFYHALAMLALGMVADRYNDQRIVQAGSCFLAGVILFSGSLYVLSLTGITVLGAITPIGGLFFIAGWLLFFIRVYKKQKPGP